MMELLSGYKVGLGKGASVTLVLAEDKLAF
jgi:hypothetical protein